MVELDVVSSQKIKRRGIFDFKELYAYTYYWLVDNKYWVIENKYSEKVGQKGKEVEISWDCYRKISDYFRYYLKIRWQILEMVEVEVEKDGKKLKMDKGFPEIKVDAILEKDYEHRWEGNPFFKFLRTAYDRYIIRGRIEKYEENIHEEASDFLNQTKSFLTLEGKP